MVTVVQLVRASDCGSECRGFESHRSPFFKSLTTLCCEGFFCLSTSSPSPSLLSARSTTVRQGSGRCPLSARSLSSCLAFVGAAVRVERLHLIGKCRPPTCLLAHVPQCPWLPITLCPASSSYAKRGKSSAWVGKGCPGADAFLERLSGVVETYISSRAGARAHTAFFVFCLHPSPTCVRRSKSNRCGEGKGEGLCSPLSSPLCESRLDCCGFWDKGRHVFVQSPLLFPHFRAVFPVRVE